MDNKNKEYTNYLKNEDFEKDAKVGYMGYPIRIKELYGYIYRGDMHKNIVLSLEPKFYGSLESSSEYMTGNDNFMKRYTTMKKLTILDLTSVDNNHKNVLDFFENEFVSNERDKDSIEKIIMVYLLQLCYGIIINGVLNMFNLPYTTYINYFRENGISDDNIKVAMIVGKMYETNKDLIPSRFGVRPFDKLLVKLLKKYLLRFKIDGILYVEKVSKDNKNLVCNQLNQLYGSTTCAPTEICIFNPHLDLGAVQIWKLENGKFIKIKHHFKRNIKKNYKRMSIYDLYKTSILNKKKKN